MNNFVVICLSNENWKVVFIRASENGLVLDLNTLTLVRTGFRLQSVFENERRTNLGLCSTLFLKGTGAYTAHFFQCLFFINFGYWLLVFS